MGFSLLYCPWFRVVLVHPPPPPSAFLRKNTQSKRQRERNWGEGGRRVVYVSIFKLTVSQEIHFRGKDGKLKERSKE